MAPSLGTKESEIVADETVEDPEGPRECDDSHINLNLIWLNSKVVFVKRKKS